MSQQDPLRSLGHPNFRLYFVGQAISMTGTWMQTIAQMWLVYRLTRSPALLGLVGFVGQAPTILFGLFGGMVADHFDRRRILLWTQSVALSQALGLAILTYTDAIQVWHVFAMAALLGSANVFDMPARQALVADLVDRPNLGNAIALNAFLINASRMIGPALAGFCIGLWGESICFFLNAASYVALIFGLFRMRLALAPKEIPSSWQESWLHIRAGLRYAFSHKQMRDILLLLSLISLAGVPFMALLPIFSDAVLRRGAQGFGLLTGASGAGAILASWHLAYRSNIRGLRRLTGISAAAFGASLVLFSVSKHFPTSLCIMTLTGWGMMALFTGCNTQLQTLTSDAMRGRVMGLFSMTFMGVTPLGNLAAGFAADRIGAPLTLAVGGLLCLVSGAVFLKQPDPIIAENFATPPQHEL
ncbi:MAG: MFS transporter [Elusimicrobia bacterium]|nr:MFS transporter [Elusimicrobiota bacterium]